MAGSGRVLLCLFALLIAGASSASACDGWYSFYYNPSAAYSYYSAPSYSYYSYYGSTPSYYSYPCQPAPAATPATVIPLDGTPPPAPAAPRKKTAAKETKQPPAIVTTLAPSGAPSPSGAPLAKDRCRVGFWNLSGRELTLRIDGKNMTIQKDRSVTMDLERNFAWQIEQRPQHVERIPDGQSNYDLVIRE